MESHLKNVCRSSEIIGKPVINLENENLGKIEDIILDKISGQAKYVILSCGGFLGFGDKFFAVPWAAINYDVIVTGFRLNVDKIQFASAPCFNKDEWSNFIATDFDKAITDFYKKTIS